MLPKCQSETVRTRSPTLKTWWCKETRIITQSLESPGFPIVCSFTTKSVLADVYDIVKYMEVWGVWFPMCTLYLPVFTCKIIRMYFDWWRKQCFKWWYIVCRCGYGVVWTSINAAACYICIHPHLRFGDPGRRVLYALLFLTLTTRFGGLFCYRDAH